jgi:hypothetical protein
LSCYDTTVVAANKLLTKSLTNITNLFYYASVRIILCGNCMARFNVISFEGIGSIMTICEDKNNVCGVTN